jgi:hypothetical protein
MGDADAVLTANQIFYRAFSNGDVDAMDALWSSAAPVACSHPGWAVLTGRGAVMDSWRTILDSPGRPNITCRGAEAHELGDAAYVTCYEDVGAGVLAATNIFVHEDEGWRMVHHQAGPTAALGIGAADAPTGVVH